MSIKENEVVAQEGIDVTTVTFDENGEVVGLDDAVMDEVAGGRLSDVDEGGDKNTGCGNNGVC